MDGKFLGRIEKASLELIEGRRFGPVFQLSFDGGMSVDDTFKTMPPVYKTTFGYTEDEWAEQLRDAYGVIYTLMRDAKVDEFTKLVGKPIEVIISGQTLKSWRILTEVL